VGEPSRETPDPPDEVEPRVPEPPDEVEPSGEAERPGEPDPRPNPDPLVEIEPLVPSGETRAPSGRERWRLVGGLLAAGLVLVVAAGFATGAFSDDGETAAGGSAPGEQAPAAPVEPVRVSVAPGDGATEVRLDAGVRVSARNGELTRVEVATGGTGGTAADGELSADGRAWESDAALQPGATYQVSWAARDAAGAETTGTASFTTLTPAAELRAAVAPLEGETVGVGQPIVVNFNQPVANKAAVEAALHVETSRPVTGAWNWTADDVLRYRPEEYWPAHTRVRLDADLAGVDAGDGVWGVEGRSIPFTIGRRQVSVANAQTHQMTVEVDGQVVRTLPISTGRPDFPTRNGIHTVLSVERERVMDSSTVGLPGEYVLSVEYAVRITNSGEFVHSAPWSVADQGRRNVSHGCVNLSRENAAWFHDMSQRGDVVEVVGSTTGPTDTEGMIEWNQTFAQWQEGSALQRPTDGVAQAGQAGTA
jgi:lipoprotein-anchoring transpeptidase ErfK/SrfK